MERVLAINATTDMMDEALSNFTDVYATSLECTMCDPINVGADKDTAGAEEKQSGNFFVDVLTALSSFLTGGGDGGDSNIVVDVLSLVSTLLGGEDTFLGGVLSALSDFFNPGAAPVDSSPLITLLFRILDILNPLSANAASVVTANDTSDFKAAAFDLLGNIIDTMTVLFSGMADVNIDDQDGVAAFAIGALSLVEDVAIFGIGTVIEATSGILAIEENALPADPMNPTKMLLKKKGKENVKSVMSVFDMIMDDIDADNATAVLLDSSNALMAFSPKVDALLFAAESVPANAFADPAPRQTLITDLVTLIATTLNSIILFISGFVSTIIALILDVASQLISVIIQLIDNILIAIAQIINSLLGIFSVNSVAVSSSVLRELAVTVSRLEGPLTLSELAACQVDLDGCPEGTTDADVSCQIDYLNCANSAV